VQNEHSRNLQSSPTASDPQFIKSVAYNYFDDDFVRSVISDGSRYVLISTGWSESSLGKMNVNNQEKQKRALALSMTQMMKIEQLGGQGKLIYLTTSPISQSYRRYLYRIFNQQDFRSLTDQHIDQRFIKFERKFMSIIFLTAKDRDRQAVDRTKYLSSNENAYRRIKLPNQIIPIIHDKHTKNAIVGFTAHFSGPYLEQLAQQWRLPYLVNPSKAALWIKKSKSRQSFRDAGVRHARGTYDPAFSIGELVDHIYDLLQIIPGRKIIVKLDQSAAGYGNRVMHFDDISADMSDERAKRIIRARFNDQNIFPASFISRIEQDDGGAIVEEFLDCKNYSSPASIAMINGEKDVIVHYIYDQLLGGTDNMAFQGSIGPMSVAQNDEGNIASMSKQIALYLSMQGVRGNVGTDFVVCDDDTSSKRIAYAIENNVRMTGTSYPYYTLRTILGDKMMSERFMKSFDEVKIPTILQRTMRDALNQEFFTGFLKNHPLNLDVATGVGCIVHNETFRIGKLGVACVAHSKAAVSELYASFTESISDYLEDHDVTLQFNRMHMTKMREENIGFNEL
jgi:hypothetical protein